MRTPTIRQLAPAFMASLVLMTGCSLAPNKPKPPVTVEAPRPVNPLANTTEYRCAGGNKINVRFTEGGTYAAVYAANKEFRLYKITSMSSARYSNGAGVILDIRGNDASFSAGPGTAYTECKLAGT